MNTFLLDNQKGIEWSKNFILIERSDNYLYEILSLLTSLDLKNKSDKENTQTIKYKLCKLGLIKGYKCYANQINKSDKENEKSLIKLAKNNSTHFKNTEWLYDLIWYKDAVDGNENDVPYTIKNLFLAMESEWEYYRPNKNKDEKNKKNYSPYPAVLYDFQKLVVGTAYINLLVFKQKARGAHGENNWRTKDMLLQEFTNYIIRQFSEYRNLNEKIYLFVAYQYDMKCFDYLALQTKGREIIKVL